MMFLKPLFLASAFLFSITVTAQPRPVEDNGAIISLSVPTANSWGLGCGVTFELPLRKEGKTSFILPLHTTFVPWVNNITYVKLYQLMPGIKFYTRGRRGVFQYAIGPQLFFEAGKYRDITMSSSGYNYEFMRTTEDIGIMANNSVNIFPNRHLFIGASLGSGISLHYPLILEFNTSFGYRF